MNKFASKGLNLRMYKYIVAVNGSPLEWSVEPVMVVKDETDP